MLDLDEPMEPMSPSSSESAGSAARDPLPLATAVVLVDEDASIDDRCSGPRLLLGVLVLFGIFESFRNCSRKDIWLLGRSPPSTATRDEGN
jgi:hypothetical protein